MTQSLYDQMGGTYDAKRIAGTLKDQEKYGINHKPVSLSMSKMNIKAKVRTKKPTKSSKKVAGG